MIHKLILRSGKIIELTSEELKELEEEFKTIEYRSIPNRKPPYYWDPFRIPEITCL